MIGQRASWFGLSLLLVAATTAYAEQFPAIQEARDIVNQVLANGQAGCIDAYFLGADGMSLSAPGIRKSIFEPRRIRGAPFGSPPHPIDILDSVRGVVSANYLQQRMPLYALTKAGILRTTKFSKGHKQLIRHEFTEEGITHLEGEANSCLRFADMRVDDIESIRSTSAASVKVIFSRRLDSFRDWATGEDVQNGMPKIQKAFTAPRIQKADSLHLDFKDGQWQTIQTGPDNNRIVYTASRDYANEKNGLVYRWNTFYAKAVFTVHNIPLGISIMILGIGHLVFFCLRYANRTLGGIGHIIVTLAFIVPTLISMLGFSKRSTVSGWYERLDDWLTYAGLFVLLAYLVAGVFTGYLLARSALRSKP